ncbi:23616_t:CDS:2 [Gigaspora rosea]|nr:23616_t:CDS:2 [Gigaspora rosea]
MYDLPISPPFGIFTAPVQDPSTPEGDNAAFRLKRESYNGVTSSQVTMSVLCKYDPKGRHANVADATKCQPIISVASELVTLKKSVCVLSEVIEWTYPNQGNSKTSDDKSIKDRKSRNEELEKLNINEGPQKESSSRAKRLKSAINQVNEIKENKSPTVQHNAEVQQHNAEVQRNAEVQHNAKVRHDAIDLTRLDENFAEHLRTTVEMDTDGLYSDKEQTNNPDDEDTPYE